MITMTLAETPPTLSEPPRASASRLKETLETEAKAPEEVMDSFSWSLGLISRMCPGRAKSPDPVLPSEVQYDWIPIGF